MCAAAINSGPLVLVAEDDRDLRELFRDLLDDDGYRTVVAIDGAEALDLALRESPDVILLDLGLPALAGPDFCRAYRECGGRAPVVLVTAADPANVEMAMEACGAVAYISKPFKIERLLETVARHVRP
jgi:DNA-binding response OmpR family regulator